MLDPVIHQQTRLRIMACLHRNRQAGFPDLRDGLGLTPGNLQSHLTALEAAGYVTSRHILANLSFHVQYRLTAEGASAFRRYLQALGTLLEAESLGGVPQGKDAHP